MKVECLTLSLNMVIVLKYMYFKNAESLKYVGFIVYGDASWYKEVEKKTNENSKIYFILQLCSVDKSNIHPILKRLLYRRTTQVFMLRGYET